MPHRPPPGEDSPWSPTGNSKGTGGTTALAVELLPMLEEEAAKRTGGRPRADQKPTQKVEQVNGPSGTAGLQQHGGTWRRIGPGDSGHPVGVRCGVMAFRRIDPEIRDRAVRAYVATGCVRAAARESGIPASTVCRWLRGPAGPRLRQAADAFKARVDLEIQRAWIEELRRPDRPAMVLLLARRAATREGLVAEELRRIRSRRRRRVPFGTASPAA